MPPSLGLLVPLALMSGHGCSGRHHVHHHRHQHQRGHHRFDDPERWAKVFESPERQRWQRPDAVVAGLELRPDDRVAEIGSGTGYFTVRIARRLPRGRAYGVDIEPSMVDYLAQRADKERLPQLSSVLGTPEDPQLPEPVDLIFLCNTYHHIQGRTDYFRRAAARLRPGGRLAIVDFKMGKLPVGPPEAMRVPPEQLERELTAAGYRRIRLDLETLPHQYIAYYSLAQDSR